MDDTTVVERSLTVEGRPARAFVGGRGEAMLLVHGGWCGAAPHWRSVWNALADRFFVVAPDLPGIGDTSRSGLGSVSAYARWLRALLDALDVTSAWCVGNSFGASVVCRFALDFPRRCRGLVLVNGFPMPTTPTILRRLGERPFGRRIVRALERRVAYTPSALQRGFVDPEKAPEELRAVLVAPSQPPLDALTDVLVQGGGSPAAYAVAPLLLWGDEDRLPGTRRANASRIHAAWPGSTLAFVPHAGHMPQIENPLAFVRELSSFVDARH